jgi:Uncharacterized low-complexity proteins
MGPRTRYPKTSRVSDWPPTGEKLTAEEILATYEKGRRNYHFVRADNVELAGMNLTGASFYCASLRGADLTRAVLTYIQFKGADLTGARLSGSQLNATDLIGANFRDADLKAVDFTGASLVRADCTGADMRSAHFGSASLGEISLRGARLDHAKLAHTHLDDVDVRAFCDVSTLDHHGPSYIDSRTVMRSYLHSGLKRFMVDCGVPEIFAEYMIDCAKALDMPLLRGMMQSTFISYGGPDEPFARRLYDALRSHNVVVFFFPETALLGERIDNEVFRQIQEHDRILLVCSRNSLERTGVVNEIQETLDREARDGGATYLLPITLDDYVLTEWKQSHPALAERVCRRIIGDFRGTKRSRAKFDRAVTRLIDALKVKRPGRRDPGAKVRP